MEDAVIGAAIGVATTAVIGYWFYFLQARRDTPLLAYRSFSWPLITPYGDAPGPDIKIMYRETEVPRLTRSRIAMWNPGHTVIDDNDVLASDALRFGFKNGSILDARVVQVVRMASNVSVEIVDGEAVVLFRFLDRGDGALIDVLHTDERGAPSWKGTIKGIPDGILNYGHLDPEVPSSTAGSIEPQYILRRGPRWLRAGLDILVASPFLLDPIVGVTYVLGGKNTTIRLAVGVPIGVVALIVGLRVLQLRRRFALPKALRLPPVADTT